MMTWDELVEHYKYYAVMKDDFSRDLGTGMLELIGLLRNDPNLQNLYLTVNMYRMVIALPDFFPPYIKIGCPAPESYEIFLEEDADPKLEPEIVRLEVIRSGEVITKVNEYLGYLNERKLEYLSKQKKKRK